MDAQRKSLLTTADFEIIQAQVRSVYPDLVLALTADCISCQGSFPVVVGGRVVDRYMIELKVPLDYPQSPPKLKELSGRIPKTPDRHFSPTTLEACVFVEDQWLWLAERCSTVLAFLQGPVNDFFEWQVKFDFFGEDRSGDRSHGTLGRIEFFKELLGINSQAELETAFLYLSYRELKGHHICYCGSGRRLRNCHLGTLNEIRRRVSYKRAKEILRVFKDFQSHRLGRT